MLRSRGNESAQSDDSRPAPEWAAHASAPRVRLRLAGAALTGLGTVLVAEKLLA
jgi:hypothetical protein